MKIFIDSSISYTLKKPVYQDDMTTNQEDSSSETLANKLDPLRPFVKRTATVYFPLKSFFSTCLISSFVRAFEFVNLVSKQEPERAIFLVPTLRGITEDIILLSLFFTFSFSDP